MLTPETTPTFTTFDASEKKGMNEKKCSLEIQTTDFFDEISENTSVSIQLFSRIGRTGKIGKKS